MPHFSTYIYLPFIHSFIGCKLLFKHDLAKRHGGQCRVCAYCQNMTHKTIQNFFGGKLEEFCTEECMSLYTVFFYEVREHFWGAFSCSCSLFLQESFTIISLVGVKLYCELIISVCFCMHYIYTLLNSS